MLSPTTRTPAFLEAATLPLPVVQPLTVAPQPARRPRSTIAQHPILFTLTVIYLGLVGLITLGPQPGGAVFQSLARLAIELSWRLSPDSGWSYTDLEYAANIAMFAPVGVLFVLLFGPRRWWLALLAGAVLTVGIEGVQAFLPGRVSDTRDLVANGTGAMIGSVVGVILTARRRH